MSLRDRSGWVEIGTTDDDLPAGHTIVEVGPDYLVVRDIVGVVETRIPVSAVRAVVHRLADQKP